MNSEIYRQDEKAFLKKTFRRIIVEISIVLGALVGAFLSPFSGIEWFFVVIALVVGVYSILGVALFPNALAFVRSMSITVHRNRLNLHASNYSVDLPFSEIDKIESVEKSGSVRQIKLLMRDGKRYKLENYLQMDDLLSNLNPKINS